MAAVRLLKPEVLIFQQWTEISYRNLAQK